MRISDWSSDVCSSDLQYGDGFPILVGLLRERGENEVDPCGNSLRPGHECIALEYEGVRQRSSTGIRKPLPEVTAIDNFYPIALLDSPLGQVIEYNIGDFLVPLRAIETQSDPDVPPTPTPP